MSLKRIDGRTFDQRPDDVTIICPIRDEIALLPHFLRHHRAIGVRHFIFIDNNSTDGTTEYLEAQPDAIVYRTEESFSAANYGMDWVNFLAHKHCQNRWIAYLDCDEHLVYRNSEDVEVGQFCKALSESGHDCAYGVMVDMYPEGSFLDMKLDSRMNIREHLNYFDTDYVFRAWPMPPWKTRQQFPLQIIGGPRCRLVSALVAEERCGWVSTSARNAIDRFVHGVPGWTLPYLFRLWPPDMPALQKKPLNYVHENFGYANSHSSTNRSVAPTLVALLHFKFCEDLARRMQADFAANHYRRGMAYMQLRHAIERLPGHNLWYGGSRKFQSSVDLEAVGLIGEAVSLLWREPEVRKVRASMAGPIVVRR